MGHEPAHQVESAIREGDASVWSVALLGRVVCRGLQRVRRRPGHGPAQHAAGVTERLLSIRDAPHLAADPAAAGSARGRSEDARCREGHPGRRLWGRRPWVPARARRRGDGHGDRCGAVQLQRVGWLPRPSGRPELSGRTGRGGYPHARLQPVPRFDVTFCFGFLYHSRHPLWVLENLARVTDHLLLTTKVFDDDQAYAYFYEAGECNNDATNWWCFSPTALDRMLRQAGFDPVFLVRLGQHTTDSHPRALPPARPAFLHPPRPRPSTPSRPPSP